ncbi:protein SCO1/2 [Chitinophaga dinghuensis]|uniref:Protein SCO1/2 n=1 Tax=Chitinophaga dinghuensis TaxID=1539050 RepID=A0A327VQU1_9BACT|nr:SCO family protein [Chitinophaga dinghuensis]RAJ77605.1 protein SCO1/2 [Chitinophaga dinghuensis]
MKIERSYLLHSWKLFLALLIGLPLIAFTIVRLLENKFGKLPVYASTTTLGKDHNTNGQLPSFVFTDQLGRTVTNSVMNNRIVVANYFFTSCPLICPKMMSQLERVQGANEGVLILSFTVDPTRDSPTTLMNYGTRYDVHPNTWRLLTGDKKSLYFFARKGLFITATEGDGGETDFIHSDRLVLLDTHQRIRGYYDGTSPEEVDELLNDIKKLQNEL